MIDLNQNRFLYGAILGGALLTVLLALLLVDIDVRPRDKADRVNDWQNVQYSNVRTAADEARYLRENPLWEAEVANRDATSAGVVWWLRAVVNEGEKKAAIVEVAAERRAGGKNEFLYLGVGDDLPNGEKIIAIDKQGIEYAVDGEQRVRRMYEAHQ